MRARILSIVLILSATLVGSAPPAQAGLWTGSCALIVTFRFNTAVEAASTDDVTNPTYSITVSPAADLNPTTTGTVEPCAFTLLGTNPFRTTSVTASGEATVWTCEGTAADGSWNQGFGGTPSSIFGSHQVYGTWGSWTMVINNGPVPTYVGTVHLTVHPDDKAKLATCETTGITTLKTIGVMTLQYG